MGLDLERLAGQHLPRLGADVQLGAERQPTLSADAGALQCGVPPTFGSGYGVRLSIIVIRLQPMLSGLLCAFPVSLQPWDAYSRRAHTPTWFHRVPPCRADS